MFSAQASLQKDGPKLYGSMLLVKDTIIDHKIAIVCYKVLMTLNCYQILEYWIVDLWGEPEALCFKCSAPNLQP